MTWDKRRDEFNRRVHEFLKSREKMQDMQSKAVDASKVPKNTSSMTATELSAAAEAHGASVLKAKREAGEAREEHAAKCREFRNWCAQQRESIPLELEARVLNDVERAEGKKLHEEIVERLQAVEKECPTSDDPAPRPKARRILG